MAWTPAQQVAIDQRKANILVSAAAGSGKTAVLTERVMQRIVGSVDEEPIELDRFLIVTFTSAAAQEMKERITQKLTDYMLGLEHNEENMKQIEAIERQIALVPQSSISTIHSFCLKIIKSYFNRLEIDPNIKVGTQAELDIMKDDILEEMLDEYLEAGSSEFLALAEVYGTVQGLEGIKELILSLSTFSKSTPFPELWLKEQVKRLKQNYQSLDETPWANSIKKELLGQVKDILAIYEEALSLCEASNGPMLYKEAIESDTVFLKTISEKQSLETIIDAINRTEFIALSRKKQECDVTLKERVKNYRDLCKDIIKGIQGDLAFLQDERLMSQLPKLGKLMETLVDLILAFEARYQNEKQEAGLVDYNDLEHYCLELLITPEVNEETGEVSIAYTEVAKELSEFYAEVYIDEYQDSNTVQEMILKAVAEGDPEKGPTRFMVGDMKQSIYRFRLANPLIFAEKYDTWEKHPIDNEAIASNVCIDLSQNFRSRDNILQGANDLFEQVMSTEVGELVYDDYAKLKVGNLYQEGHPEALPEGALSDAIELHILETKEKEEGEATGLEDLKNVECEAMMVAALVDQVLKGEGNPTHIYDKELGSYRKVEAKDIVILLRATKEKAGIFEAALMQKGIGAYAELNNNFFDALEIQTIIAYLKLIDNPMQDIPLITVLRSPIVGVSLDELVKIRKTSEQGCFYEALILYLEQGMGDSRIQSFMDRLLAFREESRELSLEELIARVYLETGYYRYVAMLPTGTKKKANLELFKKYAQAYEASNNGKLFGFIQYLDKLAATPDGLQEAKLVGENENLVRIMSIHKSKGLEFSVVFLCDTGKRFNNNDLIQPILMHNELGIAPDYMDTENYVKYPSIPKLAIKERIISENISEEMRVLYVALTRAKEKLFITGTVPDLRDKAYQWSLFASRKEESILPLGVKRAGTYLNWIGLSLYAHSNLTTLRDITGENPYYLYKGQSKWQLKVWNKEALGHLEGDRQAQIEARKDLLHNWDTEKVYGPFKDEIRRRLDFKYPYEEAVLLPTKVSVSEIKRNQGHSVEEEGVISLIPAEQEAPIPSFIKEEKALQGARRGTLIHSVFEHLDYLNMTSAEEIKDTLYKLVEEGKIEEEVLKVIEISKLEKFIASPIIQRMKKAQYTEKEKAFIYLAPAPLVNPDYPEQEEILIQGIIDAFYVDEEGITLIDYKTDYVDLSQKEASLAKIRARYEKQLSLYSLALCNIMKLPVAHTYIYLYNVNEWVRL